jgi:uncharacterized protein DUF5666
VGRCMCVLLILGGLAYAQTAATLPSFTAKETVGETVKPTAHSGAGSVPDMPPLPPGKATLLGGTISAVDHLRDRMILQIFRGGRTVVIFDDRTRVYRDGRATSLDDLKNGERVYADTVLDGTQVFARNILVAARSPIAGSYGQIVSFEPARGELTLRDTMSLNPLRVRLAPDTLIIRGGHPAQPAELRPGTLVTVAFLTGSNGQAVARRISILASPGTAFVFSGRVAHADLRRGLFVLVDPRDNKSYEVHFDPTVRALSRDVREGADVTVYAGFDGKRYAAQSITLNPPR